MKKILIAIAITAAVTSLCWHITEGMRIGIERLWLMSAVKAPGLMALEEIDTDLQRGNVAVATAKLQILIAEWRRFREENTLSGAGIGNIMVEFSHIPAPEEEK